MILRDVDDIKVGSTTANKVYQGGYKVYDKNKVALEGYCKQNTTTGKNLLPIAEEKSITTVGVTIKSNGDGSYSIKGTPTASFNAVFPITEVVLPTNAYIHLRNTGTITYNATCILRQNTTDYGSFAFGTLNRIINKTTQEETHINQIIFYGNDSIIGTNLDITLQPSIELTDTATDYEPYTGGIASPNPNYPQEIEVMEGKQVVNVSSENKLDKQYFENGSIDATTGQNINNLQNGRGNNYIPVLPNTTYTISTKNNVFQLRLSEYTNSKTNIQRDGITNNNKLTITTTSNTYYLRWSLNYDGSTTVTQQIIDSLDLQLQEGSTATPYVPYKSQDFEVDLESKNVFDINDIDNGYFTNNDGNLNTAIEGFHSNRYIGVNNGTIYIRLKGLDNIQLGRFWIQEYDENKNSIVRHTIGIYDTFFEKEQVLKYTLLLNSNTKYIRISSYSLKVLEGEEYILKKPIKDYFAEYLECTVSFTDLDTYRPYYNYKLAGIGDYKNNIYTKEGKWYVKSLIGKVVLDGSENWTLTSTANVFWTTNNYYLPITNTIICISNKYQTFTNIISASELLNEYEVSFNINKTSYPRLYIKNVDCDDVSELTTELSNNNTEVYYVLATPVEEEITSPTLIQQLNSLYQAM